MAAMHQRARSEAGDFASPRSSRAASFSSDRASIAGSVTFQMPSSIRPAPAYIAASVASQIVTDHHNEQLRDGDSDPEDAAAFLTNALFSEQALCLLNAFLDHLLFAFLSSARSPSLTAIRPAITETLKPRLAREAMATADEELQGLLAGEDDEEFPAQDGQGRDVEKWDVEKIWKRTRLRIMVYTRLGELEDEDEERYVQQERGLSMDENEDDEAGLVSWASAIFLTSVIEYVAEQTLLVSGQAAYSRVTAKRRKISQQAQLAEDEQLERIVVEEFDVEKLALNSALGRIWRTWRKRARTPVSPLSPRGVRYTPSFTSLHRRRASHDTADESIINDGVPEVPEQEPTETDIAANIALPIGNNDVNEIEVPGLARTFEEAENSGLQTPVPHHERPNSAMMSAPTEVFRRRMVQERPLSMPPLEPRPFTIPVSADYEDAELEDLPFETPMERVPSDDSYIHDERQEDYRHEDDEDSDGDHEPDADMVAFAASTGMGFGMNPLSSVIPAGFAKDEGGPNTPTQPSYDDHNQHTQVLRSKRMSIEKTGPPGIVRTYSTRSSSLRSHDRTPLATPSATPEPKSYLDDALTDDDMGGPEAIGVAHTSNMSIPTPSPPVEHGNRGHAHAKHPSHGGYVEVLPRQTAPTSTHVRSTPPPERPSPLWIDSSSHRDVQRQDVPRKEVSRKDLPRKEILASPPRQRDSTPPRTRLASLQETETWNSKQQPVVPEKSVHRVSPPHNSLKQSSSHRSREPPVAVAPYAYDVSPIEGPSDKFTLQRVSSTSSTTRSVSTSILHGARDSDISLNGRPRGLSGRMSEEDRLREFEALVQGDETVKYTLTPQTVRDIDEPAVAKRSDPRGHRPTTSSVTVYPRVNADRDNQFGTQPQSLPSRTASRSKGPIPSSGKKSIIGRPAAREPRINNESMQDFADFIRSTGPGPGAERSVQPFVALNDKPTNGSSSSISGLGRRISTRKAPSHSHTNSTATDGPSAKPRTHMEPRSPAGQRSGNDDLIDFIRQGPPNSNNGQHRIPRNVAPFRTTVDSDQFDSMLDDNGTVESAYGSQVSTASKQSSQTVNSKTGLLPKPNVTQPAYSNMPQKLSGNFSSPEPQITRTRRRVKDPYAIDTDDEDEDLLTALPHSASKPPQRDESMMDFLNSMEPSSNSPPKAFMLSPETIAAAKTRSTKNGTNSPASSMSSGTTAPRNGASSRTAKAPSAQAALVSSSITSEVPRAYKPRLQARAAVTNDARTGRSATNDLADFLRSSGPPEPSAPPPGSTIRKEESRRSNGKFWRKKTYGDMP